MLHWLPDWELHCTNEHLSKIGETPKDVMCNVAGSLIKERA
jgi:hypothetical protein